MAKFFGKVGYAHSTNGQNGVWTEVITEKPVYGDVLRNARRLTSGAEVNPDLSIDNSLSILADPYSLENIFAIRYVEWAGALWTVSSVEVQSPRLLLRLGGVYNGPTPPPAGDSAGGAG